MEDIPDCPDISNAEKYGCSYAEKVRWGLWPGDEVDEHDDNDQE